MSSQNDNVSRLEQLCDELSTVAEMPLLIMYYPDDGGSITDYDVDVLQTYLRENCKLSSEDKLPALSIILHTAGGSPDAAYQLAQIVRNFAEVVFVIVPFMAASAGTVFSFCGDKIYLGATGFLGAIDVSIDDTEVNSIFQFIRFALNTRETMETRFENIGLEGKVSSVESDLLVEMVKQIKAPELGSLYRQATVTTMYAVKLLTSYLLQKEKNREEVATQIAKKSTYDIPAHDFVLDYHMCLDIGIPVEQLNEKVSDMTRNIVKILHMITQEGIICKDIPKIDQQTYKEPLFYFYPYTQTEEHGKNEPTENKRDTT